MIPINSKLFIPEQELEWTFVRAGGPGGQNVNKVASKAVLRWHVAGSPSLPEDVKNRLRKRLTAAGDLVLSSQRFRDQARNRQDCLEKLGALLRQAATAPQQRKRTKPTRSSREARLQQKRRRATSKTRRQRPAEE